eukprot:1597657-Amphidinium_carterae.1
MGCSCKAQKARDLVVDFMVEQPVTQQLCFLEYCRLVLVRESTREVLILANRLTPAAVHLKNIFHMDTFSQLPQLPEEMQPQLESLIAKCLNTELATLVDCDASEVLLHPWVPASGVFVDDVQRARHGSLVSSPAWKSLNQMARDELDRRGNVQPSFVSLFRMHTYRHSCQPQSGVSVSNLLGYEDAETGFLNEFQRTTCRSAGIRILQPEGKNMLTKTVADMSGRIMQRLLLCAVPEDLLDDPQGDAHVPWLPASRWVATTESRSLSEMLCDEASEGYPELTEAICALAQGSLGNVLRCARA